MTVRELVDELTKLMRDDVSVADLDVWLEGCDCYGKSARAGRESDFSEDDPNRVHAGAGCVIMIYRKK